LTAAVALNPLQQRLLLYGFAYVQLDPRQPTTVQDWGLPGLQLAPVGAGAESWRRRLLGCTRWSETAAYPVASPAIALLRRIRRRQPWRPLILVRTAFESANLSRHLGALAWPRPDVAGFLTDGDAARPLRWLRAWPEPEGEMATAYAERAEHPRRAWARLCVRRRPQSRFLVCEDGSLLEQMALFGARSRLRPPAGWRAASAAFDAAFIGQFAGRRGVCRVMAEDRASLAWFARDCRRLLGPSAHCWRWPHTPDARDPLTHFILTADRDIRFAALDPSAPSFHLDGNASRRRYRAARIQRPAGELGWRAAAQPAARAHITMNAKRLTFWRTAEGWISAPAAADAPDESEALRQRLMGLRALTGFVAQKRKKPSGAGPDGFFRALDTR